MLEYSVKQIKSMNNVKIVFTDGVEIVFDDCAAEWDSHYHCSSKCVGQRNILGDKPGDKPYFIFWSKEKTKITFDGGLFRSPKRAFRNFSNTIRNFGYSSYDLS